MGHNKQTKENKLMGDKEKLYLIEKIEAYYLSVITRYIGADPFGLVKNLELHNKTWTQWYDKLKGDSKKNFFDVGAERVIYMLLNRGDILGDPNSNPIGSDSSFLKYDDYFKQYLNINIDVKCYKANTNLNDILGNTPIGKNQNSYKSLIHYKSKKTEEILESRSYTPGLDKHFEITEDNRRRKYINLTYSIVILYCENPISSTPKEQKVIAIFTNCIPNGELHSLYKDEVFAPGKTSGLLMDAGQTILFDVDDKDKTYLSQGNEKIWGRKFVGPPDPKDPNKRDLEKSQPLDQYRKLNGKRNISWNVDGRFNYMAIKFQSLNENRIQKIYLDEKTLEYFFYEVDFFNNKKRPEKYKGPDEEMTEKYLFLKELKYFNQKDLSYFD